jgi:hypothetical protein
VRSSWAATTAPELFHHGTPYEALKEARKTRLGRDRTRDIVIAAAILGVIVWALARRPAE